MKERLHLPLFLLIIRPWSEKENELGGTFMQGMAQKKKDGKVLDFIERVGNQLPHPYILFLWLCLILALISLACSLAGVSVVNPTNGEMVLAKSLISKDGLIWLLENLLSNFQGFSPLGLVLAMQIAIGFSEKVGLLTTAMRRAILGVPLWALTATVLFLGINGSIASEASIIVVPALAAAAFESVGMHPIAGLLAGYAATNAGFTACVIVAGTDVLLAGVTESAAQMIDQAMTVNATCNWYFMFVSVFTLTVAGVFVNKKFIVPRLGTYDPANGEGVDAVESSSEITPVQAKALRGAGIFSILYIVLFALMVIPSGGILRAEDGSILNGPFIKGLVPILMIYFILVGVVYGLIAGTIKKSSDVPRLHRTGICHRTVHQHVQLYQPWYDHRREECRCAAGSRLYRHPADAVLHHPLLRS